ncbi:MAG: hypothetical protein ACREKL_08030, partial [Chthoniobacterales bacterium]
IVGSAAVNAKANGQFVIKGSVNGADFTQTIKLGPGSSASVSVLLPGIASFNQSLKGHFSGKTNVTVSGSFDTTSKGGPPSPGNLKMKIGKITYGSTLSFQTILTFQNGSDPVYVTIVAS